MIEPVLISLLSDIVTRGIQTSETIKILSHQLGETESEEDRQKILDKIQDEEVRRAVFVAYQRGYQEGTEEVDQDLSDVEPRPEIDQEIGDFLDRRLETPIEDNSRQKIAAKIRSLFEEHEDVTITEIQKAFENNLEDKVDEMVEEQSRLRDDLSSMERSRRIWQAISIVLGFVSAGLSIMTLSIPLPF